VKPEFNACWSPFWVDGVSTGRILADRHQLTRKTPSTKLGKKLANDTALVGLK
jgi:hypothetical protein